MFYSSLRSGKKVIARSKLLTVLTPSVLLSDLKRHELLQLMKNHFGFKDMRFEHLVQPVVDELAIACQLLPSTLHRFYALPGGLLDFALYRAQAAMEIFRQSILPPDTSELSEEQALWAYILITAGLLRGMGVIGTDYLVECYSEQAFSTGLWQPLWERLIERTPNYTIDFNEQTVDGLSAHLTPLLAKMWLPYAGFSWIARDPQLFLIWLQLLQEESEGMHVLEAILERAEAMAWQRMAKDALAHSAMDVPLEYARISAFNQPQSYQIPSELIGIQFLLWLKENLARGQVVLNQNHLKVTEQGLIIEKEMFKWFLQQNNQYKNWRLIQQGVMSLNLHDKDFHGKEGMLLIESRLFLPKEVIIRHGQTLQHQKIQSMLLNTANNWQLLAQGKGLNLDLANLRLNAKGQLETLQADMNKGYKHV
ncbi:MAG: TraI 2 protein [Pseudomonadota bacterium]|nr:TraI 2 protein [Pseudomonadota bacterium]